jgi:hypothetical protein
MIPVKPLTVALSAIALFAAAAAHGQDAVDDTLSIPATPDQVETEMTATDLLNAVARLGYAEYRKIRREGDLYVVEVMTRDFQVREIVIDPHQGTVTERP